MDPKDFEPPEMFIIVDREGEEKYCPHHHIRIWPHHRLIKCRDCQLVIDPFAYILTAGNLAQNFITQMKWLKIQMDDMQNEHDEMRKFYKKLTKKP